MSPLGFIALCFSNARREKEKEGRSVVSRVEQEMVYHLTPESNSDQRSETQRAVVEDAQARIVESVVRLSRNCRPAILPEKAREEPLALRPHLQEALEAHSKTSRDAEALPTRSVLSGTPSRCS